MPRKSPKSAIREWRSHLATDIDRLRGFPVLRRKFRTVHGYELNLENPTSLSEKIQWRKVYDRNPLFPILLDKLRVADWLRRVLPPEDHWALPVFRQVARRAEEIDFNELPGDVALKCNHASGWNILLHDGHPFDEAGVRRQLNRWLGRRYGKTPDIHESGYLKIPPRICVQDLLLKDSSNLGDDVRFHMFGETFGIGHVGTGNRGSVRSVTYFDEEFRPVDLETDRPRHPQIPARPVHFDDMLRISRRIGAELDYVRVDFLNAGDRCFINELTLYHTSGFSPIAPYSFEQYLGDLWHLPAPGRRGPSKAAL